VRREQNGELAPNWHPNPSSGPRAHGRLDCLSGDRIRLAEQVRVDR